MSEPKSPSLLDIEAFDLSSLDLSKHEAFNVVGVVDHENFEAAKMVVPAEVVTKEEPPNIDMEFSTDMTGDILDTLDAQLLDAIMAEDLSGHPEFNAGPGVETMELSNIDEPDNGFGSGVLDEDIANSPEVTRENGRGNMQALTGSYDQDQRDAARAEHPQSLCRKVATVYGDRAPPESAPDGVPQNSSSETPWTHDDKGLYQPIYMQEPRNSNYTAPEPPIAPENDASMQVPMSQVLKQTNAQGIARKFTSKARIDAAMKNYLQKQNIRNGNTQAPRDSNTQFETQSGSRRMNGNGTHASLAPGGNLDLTDNDTWMAEIEHATNGEDLDELKQELKSLETKYNSRKKKNQTDLKEDIEFIRKQRECRTRITIIENANKATTSELPLALEHDDDRDEDEDSLFLPERPVPNKRRGRPRPDDAGSEPDASPPAKRTKTSSKKNDLKVGEVREARAKVTDKARREKRSRKDGEDADKKGRKGNDKPANKNADGKGGRKSKKKRPLMANWESLWTSNPIRDAQANAGQEGIPGFSATGRADALRQLVSSIPTSGKDKSISADRQAMMEAARKFSSTRAIKADAHGGWQLKGMKSALYHHQLLGSGWMRERESGSERPHGGLVADEMGFGKTIQMIANIIDDRSAAHEQPCRTTLIIVTPALMMQWFEEFYKHCLPENVGKILVYGPKSRIQSSDVINDLRSYDCIITSYHEVRMSYPQTDPPPSLTTEKALNDWWTSHFRKNAGPLHKIRFRRIVLDEAQQIKNPNSSTSQAVRALTAHYRWVITGTPIQNYVEEMFAYMDFLKCPHTGSFELFKANYCNGRNDKKGEINPERMAFMLQGIMLRRTYKETLFSRPIVTLPDVDHRTDYVSFNPIETTIYRFIKKRFIERINQWSAKGELNNNYRSILAMMHYLRMATGHILLVQKVLKENLLADDIEGLWRLTQNEVQSSGDRPIMNSIIGLRRLINARQTAKEKLGGQNPKEDDVQAALQAINDEDADLSTGHKFAVTFKFRKFLRTLSRSNSWVELQKRSLCCRCKNPPDEPWVTECYHVYCKECLCAMGVENAETSQDESNCMECGVIFKQANPCEGLKELGWGEPLSQDSQSTQQKPSKVGKGKRDKQRRSMSSTPDDNVDGGDGRDIDWINHSGDLLPSAKTSALKAQLLTWFDSCPNEKVVIFTQWIDMIRILEKICQIENWGCVTYHGKLTLELRNRNIKTFTENPNCKIMLCSLRAGGVGLNLTMASKVLILDLYWNNSVEKQAFCRCFRIGQKRNVEIVRYVAKDTIDEDLVNMQTRKDKEIEAVMGDDARRRNADVNELLGLFGPLREDDEEGRAFIFVDDEPDESDMEAQVKVPIRRRR